MIFNMEHITFYNKFKTSIFLLGLGGALNRECKCTNSTFTQDSCPSSRSSTVLLNWVSQTHAGQQALMRKRNRVRWGHDLSGCSLQTPMGIFLEVREGYKVSSHYDINIIIFWIISFTTVTADHYHIISGSDFNTVVMILFVWAFCNDCVLL